MSKKYVLVGKSESPLDLPEDVGIWPIRASFVVLTPVLIGRDPLALDETGRTLFRLGKLPLVAIADYDRSVPLPCYIPLSEDWLVFSLRFFAPIVPIKLYCEDIARHCLSRGKFGGNRKMIEQVAKAYNVHFGLVLHEVLRFCRKCKFGGEDAEME